MTERQRQVLIKASDWKFNALSKLTNSVTSRAHGGREEGNRT